MADPFLAAPLHRVFRAFSKPTKGIKMSPLDVQPSNYLKAIARFTFVTAFIAAIGAVVAQAPLVAPPAPSKKPITLRPVINKAFTRGEKVVYRVHYGWITAGTATMQVHDQAYSVNGRNSYKVEVTGVSANWVRHITQIRDVWGAFVDTAAIMPHKFYRNIKENSYQKTEEITFDYNTGKANVNSSAPPVGEVAIPENCLDMVTGYFYLRILDYDNLQPGTVMALNGIYETKTYTVRIKYVGKERIKTPLGYINAIKLSPFMPDNQVFAGENSVTFYISDDLNRIPLKIKAELFVGSVDLDVESYEGLRNPIRFDKKR